MNKEKQKKYVAPILVTVILLLYLIIYFGVLISFLPNIWKFILLIPPIAFACVLVYVCVERIKEIRNGEEDDLSKY